MNNKQVAINIIKRLNSSGFQTLLAVAVVCLVTIELFCERIAVTAGRPSPPADSEKEVVTGDRPDQKIDKEKLIREKLLQAVENAKKGERKELELRRIIEDLGRSDVPEELLPDFISFLKDDDPQIQFLGTQGLYVLKSPKSKEPLFEYLKGKDFAGLEEMVSTGILDERRAEWEIQASSAAILALGEIGDKSAIPLLESLRGIKEFQFEWGGGPVEQALAMLGAEGIRSLSSLGPQADSSEISKAAKAIRGVRDPNMVPQLIATVKDANCARGIRGAALSALGNMEDVNTFSFILATMRDAEYPQYIRGDAAEVVGRIHRPEAEEALLKILDDPNCDIRIECLRALASLNPEKYLPVQLKFVLDKSALLEERSEIARSIGYCSPDRIKPHLKLVAEGLKAVKEDGSPADAVRVHMWKALNRATGEEPPLELMDDKFAYEWLSYDFKMMFIRENIHASVAEIRRMVDEKIKSIIVKWQPEKGGDRPDQTIDKEKLIRERMLQAVEKAKRGDRGDLALIIAALGKDHVSQKLLSDFVSFIQNADPQVQLLGAFGLLILKSPKSTEVLSEYLKGKDFARMEKTATKGSQDERRTARWEFQASVAAIAALGKIGDKSVIPLLESIRQKANLEFEWGYSPVEEALAELGALEILSSIPPDADERQIRRAAGAVWGIKDPNMAPKLMAIVYDVNCAPPIRDSALEAAGNINTVDVPEFLLGVINDTQIPVSMRRTALRKAAETGNEIFEKTLLEIADSNSEIRIEGLCGLALLRPDKYLNDIFKMIRDEKEPDEFRNTLTGRLILYIPWQQKRQMLEGQKDELYSCLNTNKTDGSPHDEIRIRMWRLINDVFGEEPSIVLSSKSSWGLSTLKSIIQDNLRQQWLDQPGNEPWNEPPRSVFEKMADEKFKSIVTFLPEDSEAKK